MEEIPVAQPIGGEMETVRLIIGIAIMVLGLVATVLYLRWKLPHVGEDEGENGADSEQ